MKSILVVFSLMLVLAAAASASAAVRGEEVSYRAGEATMKGYLAFDTGIKGRRPGILVVHEWWGHNDYVRRRARMLAELGYIAMAVDMYGEGRQASHPEEAANFADSIRQNLPLARERFTAALAVLKQHPGVDPQRLAAIGYCFGGGVVLEMARAGIDLDGVVSFHGSLSTDNPARPGKIRARVLVANGGNDPFTTPEQVSQFKKEMEAAGADYRFINYPGARHAFTNPEADTVGKRYDMPLAYDQEADRKSWQAMQDFLREIFEPAVSHREDRRASQRT